MTRGKASKGEYCRGICKQYKNHVKPTDGNYYDKQENCRCSMCEMYMKWEGMFCPCCGYRVRRRPRSKEAAMKCQVQRGMKRIG